MDNNRYIWNLNDVTIENDDVSNIQDYIKSLPEDTIINYHDLIVGFNPFHDEHGRFSTGEAKAFVDSGKKAIGTVLHKLEEHHREIVAGAIVFGMYHIVGADFPPDVEEQLREKITNFADDAKVSYEIAKGYISKAIGALIDYRISGERKKKLTAERDKILEALINLKSAIDEMKE